MIHSAMDKKKISYFQTLIKEEILRFHFYFGYTLTFVDTYFHFKLSRYLGYVNKYKISLNYSISNILRYK